MLIYMTPPIALEVLEIGYPYVDNRLGFSTKAVVEALNGGLANLQAIGFADTFCTDQRILEDEEIDNVLQKRVEKGDEADKLGFGVYYF